MPMCRSTDKSRGLIRQYYGAFGVAVFVGAVMCPFHEPSQRNRANASAAVICLNSPSRGECRPGPTRQRHTVLSRANGADVRPEGL